MKYVMCEYKNAIIELLEVPSTWASTPFMNKMSYVWIEKHKDLLEVLCKWKSD